jgi:hypothetical protein
MKTKFVCRAANQKAPFLNIYSCKTILLPIFSLYSPDKSEYGLLFCLPQINNSGIQFWFWLFPRAKVHKTIIYSFFMEIFKLCQQKICYYGSSVTLSKICLVKAFVSLIRSFLQEGQEIRLNLRYLFWIYNVAVSKLHIYFHGNSQLHHFSRNLCMRVLCIFLRLLISSKPISTANTGLGRLEYRNFDVFRCMSIVQRL